MKAAEQYICHGGIMSIKRSIISPLLTLGFAGSVVAGVAVPLATVAAPAAPAVSAVSASPAMLYHA
jgi:hypothetical protein